MFSLWLVFLVSTKSFNRNCIKSIKKVYLLYFSGETLKKACPIEKQQKYICIKCKDKCPKIVFHIKHMEYYFERTGFLFKFHQKKRQDKLLKTMWNLRHSWGFYRKCTKSIKRWQGYAQAVKINRFRKPIFVE